MKYLKFFNNHSGYTEYRQSEDMVLPNVSRCDEELHVHYTPNEAVLTVRITLNNSEGNDGAGYDFDTNQRIIFCQPMGLEQEQILASDKVDAIYIDSVKISLTRDLTSYGYYNFRDYGEHEIKYKLKDETVIPNDLLYRCFQAIVDIIIPDGVETIGSFAFSYVDTINSIVIPDSVTAIDNYAFQDAYFRGGYEFTIPNTVTTLGVQVFNSAHVKTVILPNSITEIPYAFFSRCDIETVIIPDSVTKIGNECFWLSGLDYITIPSGVTSIGNGAFNSCSSLTDVYVEAATPPAVGGAFNSTNCTIYVPAESVETYKAASGWSSYASRIQAMP